MKIISANRIAPDGTPRFVASHLGLFCLPVSKRTKGLYGLNIWSNFNELELLLIGYSSGVDINKLLMHCS